MVVSPADETTTCFIGRWGNVKYGTRYYFSFFWLRNQLKLLSLCFMYHDDDDVPVLRWWYGDAYISLSLHVYTAETYPQFFIQA